MARPLSNDLRERAVSAVLAGESCRSVALRFSVAISSVVKWSQRHRATGSVAPAMMGGRRRSVLEPHRGFIERIEETPHLTLHGLKNELAAHGVKVSHNAVWLFLRREGLRFKKNAVRALSKGAPTSLAGGDAGDHGSPASILDDWFSSTRPGSRPTWRRCAAGERKASGCAASRRRAAAHAHLPRRAAPGSARRALRLRRPDQRRVLSRLCRTATRARPSARRHRRDGHVWTPPPVQEESSKLRSAWSGADMYPASDAAQSHAAGPYGSSRIGSITISRARGARP